MRKKQNNTRGTRYELRGTSFLHYVLRTSYLALIISLNVIAACTSKEAAHDHDTYTCPMHPTVIADKPGTCPVCGMDLVRKARAGEEVKITEDLAKLIKSPNEIVVGSIKTSKGVFKSVPVSIEAQGIITYDTRNIYSIPSRVSGRLEKVYVKYAFQPVVKGEKIASIYSPELITAQRELLFIINNDPENTSLINAAKSKLQLLGLTNAQIQNIVDKKENTSTVNIYSPYTGYVITDQKAPTTSLTTSKSPTTSNTMEAMGSSTQISTDKQNNAYAENGVIVIREGNYINAGDILFSIINKSALRIELDIPTSGSSSITEGAKLKMTIGENKLEATVDFIQPFFSEGQDFLKVRVYPSSSESLHVGELVNAKIQLSPVESLWVPRESVLNLGTESIVFVKEKEVLKPKNVKIGISEDGMTQITAGLASSDEIAENAQFLIDSESFIKH